MKIGFLLLLDSCTLSVFPQQSNTISGVVKSNQEPLAFANVYVSELNKGTITDKNGAYELTDIPKGTYTLTASYVGFQAQQKQVSIANNLTVNFTLTASESLD